MGAILESRPHIKIAQWYIITDQLSGLGKAHIMANYTHKMATVS